MKKLYKSDAKKLTEFINSLVSCYDLYAPVLSNASSEFSKVQSLEDANLNLINVKRSPKFQLIPQSQKMFSYNLRSGEVHQETPSERNMLFYGVRPCDASAIGVLDSVLLNGKFQDSYYSSMRSKALIISVACDKSAPSCFCNAMGTGPVKTTGGDLSLLQDSEITYVIPTSQKGLRFIEEHPEVFQDASKDDGDSYMKKSADIEKNMSTELDADASIEKLRKAKIEDVWSQLGERCIGCGICAYFCPTCYCFDVLDLTTGNSCQRIKGWDTCATCDFTKIGGGLDLRPTKDKRFRHRIYHKMVYVPDAFGVKSCVGCGRCVSLCPANIDIREVLKA